MMTNSSGCVLQALCSTLLLALPYTVQLLHARCAQHAGAGGPGQHSRWVWCLLPTVRGLTGSGFQVAVAVKECRGPTTGC